MAVRHLKNQSGDQHAPGYSGIHIKKSHRGLYTARAKAQGHSVQEQARLDLANPNVSGTIKKRANFAKEAGTWNHG